MPRANDAPQGDGDRRNLIIISNRLPVSMKVTESGIEATPSSGGLASALNGLETVRLWIGWPGAPIDPARHDEVRARLAEERLLPVFLTEEQEQRFYRDVCNDTIWPLFHYFTDRMRFDHRSWETYVQVNRMFADAVLACCEPDSRVWVHDFQLMLVPAMLREQRPDLAIGFFLHTPFPSSEIYRLLPPREEVLRGLLGCDYISFHTSDYTRHFRTACLRVLGLESDPDAVHFEGRRIGIGTDPIGIDVAGFDATLRDAQTPALIAELGRRYAGRQVILNVERLDYTKGIPLKLAAFERFLERDPARAQHVTMLQILVPSRLANAEYQQLKDEIERAVGRINGCYGHPGITPIEYMHRSVSPQELVALYRYADLMLVTPIRDGMNLVAQEFVLCQGRHEALDDSCRGMLALSEFAGAAHSLAHAILVNPWNIEETADSIEYALAMPVEERCERMIAMADRVREMDCRQWAAAFVRKLARTTRRNRSIEKAARLDEAGLAEIEERFASAAHRVLLLDYDGTLREIARHPEQAQPTREICSLLTELCALPNTDVHVISGRQQPTLNAWFGALPVSLCAEHGYFDRPAHGEWSRLLDVDTSWMPRIRELLEQVTDEVPGTLVEQKSAGLAWHYRMADLDYGLWRARELLNLLEQYLTGAAAEVLHGHRVVEVRAKGVNKGAYVRRALARRERDAFVLCIGDDRTDADMYRELPPDAFSINVGHGGGGYRYEIESPARVRALLRRLVAAVGV